MRFFSTSALLVLSLASVPASGRLLGRRLQDPAPAAAAPATPEAHNATAAAPATTEHKELPACKDNFPPAKYEKSGADPFSFEAHKEAPFYKRTLAELAPCLLVEGDCGGSVHKIDVLTGALATVTQGVFDTVKAAPAAPAAEHAAAPAPAADAQKQQQDAPPAVPAGENAAPATTPATPEAHNATTAATPEAHNATAPAETKPAEQPATPAAEHPAAATPEAHNATAPAETKPAEHPATPAEQPAPATPEAHAATPAPEHNTTAHATPEGHNATAAATPEAHNATAPATTTTPAGGVDLTKFTEALSNSLTLKGTINEHAPCVANQPGGVDGFIKDYAKAVHAYLA